jgi:hypothetical protein
VAFKIFEFIYFFPIQAVPNQATKTTVKELTGIKMAATMG